MLLNIFAILPEERTRRRNCNGTVVEMGCCYHFGGIVLLSTWTENTDSAGNWRLSILLWSLRQKFNPTSYRIRKIFPFDQLFSSKRTVQNNIYKWKIVFYKSISTDFYLTCRKDFWLLFSKLGWKNSNFSFIPSLKKSD